MTDIESTIVDARNGETETVLDSDIPHPSNFIISDAIEYIERFLLPSQTPAFYTAELRTMGRENVLTRLEPKLDDCFGFDPDDISATPDMLCDCPYCGASRSHLWAEDWWAIYTPTDGRSRAITERHPQDEHKWRVMCGRCNSQITHGYTADSAQEAIDVFIGCDHENRTNSLSMSTRPNDHLDSYVVTPSCADCGRSWESEYAFVDEEGNPQIA